MVTNQRVERIGSTESKVPQFAGGGRQNVAGSSTGFRGGITAGLKTYPFEAFATWIKRILNSLHLGPGAGAGECWACDTDFYGYGRCDSAGGE